MLLKSQAVSYCQLVRQVGTDSEIINGVIYKGNLFAQGNSYHKDHREQAITEMRRCFLDPEPPIACLLVEDGEIVTIWHEDLRIVKIVETTQDIVTYINLEQLIDVMKSPAGVEVKNRWYEAMYPHRCFVGKIAIDWMLTKLPIDREEAKLIGNRLIQDGWIEQLPMHLQDAKFIGQRLLDRAWNHTISADVFEDSEMVYEFIK
jgi:Domain found in Dishevelled, Egl-10, and Pleckstrin (DEP)